MQWRRGSLLAGLAVLVAGCNLSSDINTSRPIGVIQMVANADTTNGFSTNPTVAFLKNVNLILPNSQSAPDSCVDSVLTQQESGPPLVGNVGGGTAVTAQSDLATATLPATLVGGGTRYQLASGDGPLHYTPGSTIVFTIPGDPNGFPGMTFSAVTTTPFSLGPIETNPTGDLRLTWGPVQDKANAALVISLEYSTSPTSSTADRQIYCAVKDDGAFDVPFVLAEKWKNSSAAARYVTAYRWRSTLQIQNSAIIAAYSHYNAAPKSTFP
jgi:hypothetical protein